MSDAPATPDSFLTPEEQALLLRLARDSLVRYVAEGALVDIDDYPLTDALQARHGCFVTLRTGGRLRGCIGYTHSRCRLAEAVRDNVINAASRDPRFAPVTREELPGIRIEISALCPGDAPGTPYRRMTDPEREVAIGEDGLYLEVGDTGRGGLLLPQVPVEQGWEVEEFLEGICRKAGAVPGAWRDPDNTLYRFRAQVFAE